MPALADVEFVLLAAATAGYAGATALYWISALARRAGGYAWAWRIAAGACLVQGLWFVVRAVRSGHLPLYSGHDFAAVFAGGAVLAVLTVERLSQRRDLGVFALPVALGLLAYAWTLPRTAGPLILIFDSLWLTVHISTAVVAYACFATAFAASCVYLIISRSDDGAGSAASAPALLDHAAYQVAIIGFPFMTVCVISGAIWAETVWGRYWAWDPKETWSLVTWLVFAAYLHARYHLGWRQRKAAVLAIVGFLTVLMNFIGVEMLYQYEMARFGAPAGGTARP